MQKIHHASTVKLMFREGLVQSPGFHCHAV